MKEGLLGRRRLIVDGAAAVALTALGCVRAEPTPTRVPTRTPAVETPTTVVAFPAEVTSYYPEMQRLPRQSGIIRTNVSETKWFNFSEYNFNSSIAQGMYAYFESLARKDTVVNYQISGSAIRYELKSKPKTKRILYLISSDDPQPSWPNTARSATTTDRFQDESYKTFVRVYEQNNLPASSLFAIPQTYAMRSFATEAYQSTVLVAGPTVELANLGQEIVGNSFGIAFGARQMGLSYEEYKEKASAMLIGPDPSRGYSLYVLTQPEYNEIPLFNDFVVSKR